MTFPRILIAGGGVVGSTLALALARAGAGVTLADPAPDGQNASAIAAGMLAPAFESVFDGGDAETFARLKHARDLWPEFAASLGVEIDHTGAMAVGAGVELDEWQAQLAVWGASAQRLSGIDARGRAPWLADNLGGLWTDEDWRLDARSALRFIQGGAEQAGVRRLRAAVADYAAPLATLADGAVIEADALIIATGASRSLLHIAPELAGLSPIKGHILRAPELILAGPVARFEGGYVCPDPAGAIIGATMELGRDDRILDSLSAQRIRETAARVCPAIAATPVRVAAGVRATTADHDPLVGPSVSPGVWLAVGARRNGWLLAPLMARFVVASCLTDPAPSP